MNQQEYREGYLKSDHWRVVRSEALERADHRCQVCNGRRRLDVHHRTYERLGHEELGDLTVLCRRCHGVFHKAGSLARRPGSALEPPPELRKRQRKRDVRIRHEELVSRVLVLGVVQTRQVAELTGLTVDQAGGALVRLQRTQRVERLDTGDWQAVDNG